MRMSAKLCTEEEIVASNKAKGGDRKNQAAPIRVSQKMQLMALGASYEGLTRKTADALLKKLTSSTSSTSSQASQLHNLHELPELPSFTAPNTPNTLIFMYSCGT